MTRQQEDVPTGSVHCHGPVFRWQESILSSYTASAEASMLIPLDWLYRSDDVLAPDQGSGGTGPCIVFVAQIGPSSTSTTSDSPRKSQSLGSRSTIKPSVAQMLIDIRSSFGIGMSQLAKFLQVERPTVYAWLHSRNDPRHDNRKRIESIWELAQNWSSRALPARATALGHVAVEGKTICDLLEDKPLRDFVIRKAIHELALDTSPVPRTGRKGRQLARRFGKTESQEAFEQFEAITERPFAEDQ